MKTGGLINTISDGEKFSFHAIDIHCIMKGLDNRSVVDMNISNRDSHIVSDAGIGNNKSMQEVF